jgi:trk system potassium uptake protein TrkA
MQVVILGCGRVGARLAQLMEAEGHDVAIIDSNPEAFNRLPEDFKGQTVLGTGIDVDVLKAAGIGKADAFAAVTNFDNTNIMACEVAKEIFGVKQVLARIYDPGREGMYHQLGLQTICPTTLVSTEARNILVAALAKEEAQEQVPAPLPSPQPAPPAIATPRPEVDTAHENGRGLRGFFKHQERTTNDSSQAHRPTTDH